MNKNQLLWILVVANVLLAFASVGAQAFFGWTLPPSLAEYTRLRFSSPPSPIHLFVLITSVTCAFAAWIGLVCYWRFARRLYLFSCASSILLILVSGPSVRPSVGAAFSAMSALVGGAIIGLVYFSDLSRRFETPVERQATDGMSLGAHRA